jgi:hypothetical protein
MKMMLGFSAAWREEQTNSEMATRRKIFTVDPL